MNPLVATLAQFLRFGLVGIVITLLSAISYWLLAARVGLQPNLALLLVFAVFSAIGYVLHGRFSFGAGTSGRGAGQYQHVNGAALAINQAWIWLLVDRQGLPVWAPVIPMVLVTPVATFLMLRHFVYRSSEAGERK
jgi:putative flippase GtrA